jgi:TP901-1 family phage major tail protein
MAIKNASDLLVYRLYPVAVKQVTRIRVKNSSPLDATGNIILKNAYLASGTFYSGDLTLTCNTNNASTVLDRITDSLSIASFSYASTSQVVDGDYTYVDYTSAVAQENLTFYFENGTADIDEGAIEIIVLTEGEDAGADAVAHSTSASISFNNDLRDITTKDSGGYQENAGGLRSFELSTDALQDISADQDFYDFFSDISQRNEVSVRFAERDTGASTDVKWEGSGYISSLSMDAGVEENVTYSVTITGTGVVTKGTY